MSKPGPIGSFFLNAFIIGMFLLMPVGIGLAIVVSVAALIFFMAG